MTLGALQSLMHFLTRGNYRLPLDLIQLGLLGYLAWLLGEAVLLWYCWQDPAGRLGPVFLLSVANGLICLGLALYLAGFLLPPAHWTRDDRDWRLWLGLVVGNACAFGTGLFHTPSPFERLFQCFFLLNYVPLLARFRPRVALRVLLVQAGVMALLTGGLAGLFVATFYALAGLVLLWLTNAALRERHFREQSELHAARLAGTRHLLEQAVAEAERARLARDLHDQMGHHLVALNLRLQLLERSTSLDEVREHLARARPLASLLFADLRNTVRDLREPMLDLRAAIEALAAHLPGLHVELDMTLEQGEVSMAEADCLLRCIQEAMTNAVKHGRATRLRVALEHGADGLLLTVRDNGRAEVSPGHGGHGLQGLRERLQALAGRLWTEHSGEGFALFAYLPRSGTA